MATTMTKALLQPVFVNSPSTCVDSGSTRAEVRFKQKSVDNLSLSSPFLDMSGISRLKGEERETLMQMRSVRPTVEARLFGPALFEASKLSVLFLGVDKEEDLQLRPRIYTLTHSDVTAKLTLAISEEINKAQLKGWYSSFQRDEVLGEWKKVKGHMALHVHCHISGGNFYHNMIANFRYYIFRKELPVVLAAFLHGDREFFEKHPELEQALVWVYFHSNVKEYNKLECWGPLVEAAKRTCLSAKEAIHRAMEGALEVPQWPKQLRPRSVCAYPCECCSRHGSSIPLPESFAMLRQEHQEASADVKS